MPLGLRTRLVLGIAALTLAATGTVGAVALWAARSLAVEKERDFGRALAQAMALARLDREAVDPARTGAFLARVRERSGAEEITWVDAKGVVLASSDDTLAGTRLRDPAVVEALQTREGSSRSTAFGVSFAEPVVADGRLLGAARVVLRPRAAASLERARRVIVGLTLLDALVVIVAGAFLLGLAVVRPIGRLRALTRRVAEGDLGYTVPVEGEGEMAELVRAANDMSLALRAQMQRLDRAREQLIRSEKLASVGRLAAGIAHEVGNPLASIMGYAEVLRDPTVGEDERREIAGRVGRETARIHEILRELLDYARPAREQPEEVDLAKAVDAAVSLAQHHRRWRDVEVVRDLPPDLPPARAVATRLMQVFMNLLLNAADAMDGRGRVRVAARDTGDGHVEVRVSDTGPGVPAELRDRIFDPFVTTKEPGEGTGLGLAICHSIVESHGGSIRLEDAEGGGATFVVRLPRFESGS